MCDAQLMRTHTRGLKKKLLCNFFITFGPFLACFRQFSAIAQPSQASKQTSKPTRAGVSTIFGSIYPVCMSHSVKAKRSEIEAIAPK